MIYGMLSDNITINGKTIGDLLKLKQLEVPPNQRSYRWKSDHADELFSDIKTAIEDGTGEHFLGSIVSVEADGKTLIFDGQQRLATTMILPKCASKGI
jgi:uncharacterized protein with ParB-like and HNH nuclease domain